MAISPASRCIWRACWPRKSLIPALDLRIAFRRGETIHTENSYKFTPERVTDLLAQAGYGVSACLVRSAHRWFGVFLARVL